MRTAGPLRCVAAVAALVAVGIGLTGCGSTPPPPIAIQPPVATTLSWFQAVNAHNMPVAQEHFVRTDRDMMNWTSWGPPFKDLHCRLSSATRSSADVYCTFATINSDDMSNVSFWDVYLQRDQSGRWLINNYGQG
jgi:hypothetical protein